MIVQYDHTVLSSFKEWFNHVLLDEGQAYKNITSGQLYEREDRQWKNYNVFTAPYHQWVYDSSVAGANVPSGVYVSGIFVPRSGDGLHIDFNHGRAIFDDGAHDGDTVRANYAVKEFNIYLTSKPEEKLIADTKFDTRPVLKTANSGVDPRSVILPCIFIKQRTSKNEPWAFGGEDLTTHTVRAIVFATHEYQSVGVKSLFRDKNNTAFCLLADTPINEFGDIKVSELTSGVWNYDNNATGSSMMIINDVVTSDIENDLIAQNHPNLYVSIIEFKLMKSRYPRQ